nr:hypothetical protein [Candidatus Sigynarchaeota archaeon]
MALESKYWTFDKLVEYVYAEETHDIKRCAEIFTGGNDIEMQEFLTDYYNPPPTNLVDVDAQFILDIELLDRPSREVFGYKYNQEERDPDEILIERRWEQARRHVKRILMEKRGEWKEGMKESEL